MSLRDNDKIKFYRKHLPEFMTNNIKVTIQIMKITIIQNNEMCLIGMKVPKCKQEEKEGLIKMKVVNILMTTECVVSLY